MRLCAFAALVLLARPAWADLFSPGELIDKHQHLEGVSNCKACHPRGDELSAQLCLACHTELAGQVARGRGYHGRLPTAEREQCEKCHRDHQGRKQPPTEWGSGGVAGFDHDKAGYPLEKGHAEVKCAECHRPGLYALPEVAAWVAKHKDCKTFLGAPRECKACHFDEHRGGASDRCESCHDANSWKKTPKYDHVKGSEYPLKGKHRAVKCAECHPTAEDPTPVSGWPKPLGAKYLKLAPIPHQTCKTCHADDDVHKGHYGPKCESCHVEADWKTLKGGAMDRIDHDKYRYPLEGAHAQVECAACHGPWPGLWPKPKYKGIPFARCTDCHFDAHFGQVEKGKDCAQCHTVQGFKPTTYGQEQHQKARWPLEGAHRAVACSSCHREEPALASRADPKAKAALRARGRPETASLMRLLFPQKLEACETCHADVHQGQFEKKSCDGCHSVETFRAKAFDHGQSRFPLEGAHQKAACGGCHPTEKVKGRPTVRYRPVETACSACHAEAHAGQFGKPADCARCHGAESFEKGSKFAHAPPFTEYLLEGAHQKVKCEKCHPEVSLGKGKSARRYKPLPQGCSGCHVDQHEGAFAGFVPLEALTKAPAVPAGLKQSSLGGEETKCESCHTAASWSTVGFPHEKTGFPLKGAHRQASCKGCHVKAYEDRVPATCGSCHKDAHAGSLGFACQNCHDEQRWRGAFGADAHRLGNFPLTGRHAAISCRECHPVARDSTFSRPTSDCIGCHGADYGRTELTGPSHQASGFGRACRMCHDTWRFKGAKVAP